MNASQRDVMVALPSLLVVVAVAIGVYSLPPALDSLRPEVPRRPLEKTGQIPARLWQDPLHAIWSLPAAEVESHLQASRQVLDSRPEAAGRTLILAVLIPGSAYSESHEIRLRLRYAVLTALGASGYAPEQAEKIGAFSVPPSEPAPASDDGQPPPIAARASRVVPFEWHRYEPSIADGAMPDRASRADKGQDAGRYEQVLVLWVDENGLGTPFLKGLHEVMDALQQEQQTPCEEEAGLCVEVIGPSSSTGFKPYLALRQREQQENEVKSALGEINQDRQGAPHACLLTGARLNSPLATTWDKSRDQFELPYQMSLQRIIGSDLDLCGLLKVELGLRNVTPAQDSQIVLITEMDTVYGRTFPATFRSVFKTDQHRYIHEYTYLRGIDGQIPGAKESKDDSKSGASNSSAGVLSVAEIERPEGRSQYDYLRRMEQLLKANHESRSIRAIGVTGTDVYDKLLILRSLRSSFSDALFFTTDLDVRLLHPGEYDSARNLLIATHFSLGLGADMAFGQVRGQESVQTLEGRFAEILEGDDHQAGTLNARHVPPFRYSYQSSVFLAALGALNPSKLEAGATPSHPRLFEVGRKGGILLNPEKKQEQTSKGPILALTLLMASIACSLFRPDMSRMRRDLTEKKSAKVAAESLRSLLIRKLTRVVSLYLGWLLLRLLPFAVLAQIAASDSASRDGEVWAVFGGVSLWPSQFLLLLLVMLAIEFAIRLVKDFEVSKLKLDLTYFDVRPEGWRKADFQLNLPDNLSERIRFCWKEFKAQVFTELRLLGTYSSAARDNPDHRWGRTDVLSLWRDYRQRTSPGAVSLRLMLYAWLVIPAVGLIYFWAPARPFRGDLSLWVDRGLLAAALLAIGFLLVLVWDITFFTSLFTHKLAGRESLWPRSTVEAYSKKGWPSESYSGELINEWLDVQFIARHTQSIGSFIYYPFILLLLYAVAHHPVFDNWIIRPQEILIFLAAMALASIPLMMMRRSAESARRLAVQRLSVKTMEAQGQQDSGPRLQILRRCLGDIEAIGQGAFSSLVDNPLLRAALIPFGGMGGLALLEFMLL